MNPPRRGSLREWILEKLGPDVPLHFTAFHPDFKLRDKPRTPPETLHTARRIAREVGLHYVYEGNIYSDGANTLCPKCGELLVRRSWHDVLENHLQDGACARCGFAIAGAWQAAHNRGELEPLRESPIELRADTRTSTSRRLCFLAGAAQVQRTSSPGHESAVRRNSNRDQHASSGATPRETPTRPSLPGLLAQASAAGCCVRVRTASTCQTRRSA